LKFLARCIQARVVLVGIVNFDKNQNEERLRKSCSPVLSAAEGFFQFNDARSLEQNGHAHRQSVFTHSD
jgi:hypothetical protein